MASEILKRDDNRVTVLGLEKNDGSGDIVMARADAVTGRLLVSATGAGTGDVTGPGSSTDNAVARFDGTTGQLLQDSVVLVGDTGIVTGLTFDTAGSGNVLKINGTQVSAVAGTGAVVLANTPTLITPVIGVATGTSLALSAATSLTIGTASSLAGSVVFQNATNANTLTIKSGVVSSSYALTFPTAVGGAGTVLTDAAGNGVLSWVSAGGTGTVTTVSVASANGFSGTVANATTTPAITIIAGDITPTSVGITGTAGAGFIKLVSQASNPTPPAAGTLLLHSSTLNGFTRMEQDNEATTNLVLGRDSVYIAQNVSGGTINKGQTVYVFGVNGTTPTVKLARANANTTLPCAGIALDAISDTAFGQIMLIGICSGFDTSAFSANDQVWVSTSAAGGLTNVRPSGTTNLVQRVGTVIVSNATTGAVLVDIAPAILNQETGTKAATWTGSAVVATTYNGNTFTTGTGTLTLGASKTLSVSDTTTIATNAITLGGGEVITFSATNALSLLTTGATSVTLPTSGTLVSSVTTGNGVSATNTAGALAFALGAITPNTVVASDATTPHFDTVAGSTNTGYFLVNGKTNGSFKITTADSTAQAITLTVAAQTVGAATLTIPNMANVNKTVAWLESPSFTTPNIGAATATSVNGMTITASTGTFTLTNAKTFAVAKSLTLDGTDSTTMTFPTTSATIARTDAANTFSGIQTITNLTLPDQGQIKLTVPTTDLKATGPTCGDFNSGYSSSAIGDLVYLDSSSTWQKCDANTLALYNGFLGIALEVKASGNALLVALPGSFIYSTTGFSTWTIGSPIYMSETAGAMTQTQPTTTDAAIRVVGWGVHADKMYFYPSPDYVTHT